MDICQFVDIKRVKKVTRPIREVPLAWSLLHELRVTLPELERPKQPIMIMSPLYIDPTGRLVPVLTETVQNFLNPVVMQ